MTWHTIDFFAYLEVGSPASFLPPSKRRGNATANERRRSRKSDTSVGTVCLKMGQKRTGMCCQRKAKENVAKTATRRVQAYITSVVRSQYWETGQRSTTNQTLSAGTARGSIDVSKSWCSSVYTTNLVHIGALREETCELVDRGPLHTPHSTDSRTSNSSGACATLPKS